MTQNHLTRKQRQAKRKGCHFLGEMREWRMRKEFMPDVVMMINRNQYQKMVLYIDKEFRYSDIARNDPAFHMCDTSKYQDYIFLQCSDPDQLALALWNDKVINKYLRCFDHFSFMRLKKHDFVGRRRVPTKIGYICID